MSKKKKILLIAGAAIFIAAGSYFVWHFFIKEEPQFAILTPGPPSYQ